MGGGGDEGGARGARSEERHTSTVGNNVEQPQTGCTVEPKTKTKNPNAQTHKNTKTLKKQALLAEPGSLF
jgi:hypothetical protein